MKHPAARTVALSLALLTVVGCSSGPKTGTPSGSTAGKPMELTMMGWEGMSIEASQALTEAYTKKHPNVHITLKDAQMEQMGTKGGRVNTALLDGTDIAILPAEIASSYNEAGMLKDLSTLRLPAADASVAGLVDEMGKQDGQRFGVPIALNPASILLNDSALQKAGIKTPSPDWTYQDLEQFLSAATTAGLKVTFPAMITLDPLVRAYGGQMYNSDQKAWTLDTPEVKQGLAEAAKLAQAGWMQTGGGIMIALGGPNTPALQVLPPDALLGGGEMGSIMPFPKGPKGRATPVGAVVAVVNKSSANADTAADFVKEMLANPAAQLALARSGIRPVTADTAAMAAWREKVGDAKAQAYDQIFASGYVSQSPKFYASLTQGLVPYLNGTSSLDQVLPGLQSSLPAN